MVMTVAVMLLGEGFRVMYNIRTNRFPLFLPLTGVLD